VYTTCLFCHRPLGSNNSVEQFPIGRRLAFDAAKGRLWVICKRCKRWNLSPLEERWEAIESCERLFAGTTRRVSTENIGLAELAEGLRLVRIGRPQRPEFAAWRYGRQFGLRRRRAMLVGTAVGVAAVGGAIATGGMLAMGFLDIAFWSKVLGGRRVIANVRTEDGTVLLVNRKDLDKTHLETGPVDADWGVRLSHMGGSTLLRGEDAMRALFEILPRVNRIGGSKRTVDQAVGAIEEAGTPAEFFQRTSRTHDSMSRDTMRLLPAHIRLAMEMAAHEEAERGAFEGDLRVLEAAWRGAEEIAEIADNLLVSPETEDALGKMRRGPR
jgi:hypothetical protein